MKPIAIKTERARTYWQIPCETCGQLFWRKRSALTKEQVQGVQPVYCSSKCSSKGQDKKVKVTCVTCKKEFQKSLYKVQHTKSGLHFCSRVCKDRAQVVGGSLAPAHYGTGEVAYRRIAFRKHGKVCSHCGYKEYEEGLDVHHIDEDRTNNSLENLLVLCSICHSLVTRGRAKVTNRKLIIREVG